MINYYFQLPTGSFWQGQPSPRYLVQHDYHPDDLGRSKYLHVVANILAESVWLENANGVIVIKRDGSVLPDHVRKTADDREFIMVKLQAQLIE